MQICEEEGVDPFRALVRFARGPEDFDELPIDKKMAVTMKQFEALKEICSYLYPKRKAVEHSGEINNPYMGKSIEELQKLVKERLNKK